MIERMGAGETAVGSTITCQKTDLESHKRVPAWSWPIKKILDQVAAHQVANTNQGNSTEYPINRFFFEVLKGNEDDKDIEWNVENRLSEKQGYMIHPRMNQRPVANEHQLIIPMQQFLQPSDFRRLQMNHDAKISTTVHLFRNFACTNNFYLGTYQEHIRHQGHHWWQTW